MKIQLTIRKEKNGQVWGHVFMMNNLLIEHASSVDELKEKIVYALVNYYELEKENIHFDLITAPVAKARNMVARLSGAKKYPPIKVKFNSDFFDS